MTFFNWTNFFMRRHNKPITGNGKNNTVIQNVDVPQVPPRRVC